LKLVAGRLILPTVFVIDLGMRRNNAPKSSRHRKRNWVEDLVDGAVLSDSLSRECLSVWENIISFACRYRTAARYFPPIAVLLRLVLSFPRQHRSRAASMNQLGGGALSAFGIFLDTDDGLYAAMSALAASSHFAASRARLRCSRQARCAALRHAATPGSCGSRW